MTKFSFSRPITDYAKVQHWISSFIRGKKQFINKKRIKGLTYLDVGCGPNTSDDYINLDYSWYPKVDVCWDISKNRLPFEDGTIDGIFTEHCLEHISFGSFKYVLAEFHRVLRPSGNIRIIMPDGQIYLDQYQKMKTDENATIPYYEGYLTPMARINGIFREHGHLFIYDFETVEALMNDVGFSSITKETFQHGRNNRLFNKDSKHREVESLYVEATK